MIRLARPHIDESTIDEVGRVLRSGNLVQGLKVKVFEEKLQNYLGVKKVIAVSSGTAALHLSLLSLDIGPGDEVIVPAFTYPATANTVEQVGAKTILVDIRTEDFCIDIRKIEEKISSKTKAIVPVHEFGHPSDMDDIIKLANKYNLKIIEDSACSLGTNYKGKKTGSLGDLGCFSFHPRKAITTGEGGAICTNNEVLAKKIKSIRNHGSSLQDGKIIFNYAGLNYRMTEFQAVLGISELAKLDSAISHRNKIAERYSELLKDFRGVKIPANSIFGNHNYQSYHILLESNINRDSLIDYLRDNHVETNLGAYAIHMLKYYKEKYGFNEDLFINSKIAFEKGLVLPIGEHIDLNNVELITKEIKKGINGNI